MVTSWRIVIGRVRGGVLLAILALSLSACAGKSYVVLLDNEDGTTGKVMVSGPGGGTTLERRGDAAEIGAAAGARFNVSEAQIDRDFGPAIAARPKAPRSYRLYFETGRAVLTAASQTAIPEILAEVSKYPAPEIFIVGHTDTVGSDEDNVALGLSRARRVADMMAKGSIIPHRVTIDSFGEKHPLIPTPDDTPEPRNRRVEVTVR